MSNNRLLVRTGVEGADLDRLAEIFKALSHPHRIAVFARLAACCGMPAKAQARASTPERMRVGELGDGLGIAPSTLSHHLKELRRAGLVQVERNGQTTECWVEPATLQSLSAFFGEAVCNLFCR